MLALTTNGKITQCRAKVMGNGRCNHVAHQGESESAQDFIVRVNELTDNFSMSRYRKPISKPKTLEEKKKLSGKFESCEFTRDEDIEELSGELIKQKQSFHNELERRFRNEKVGIYEKEFTGKVQDMFIVDRGHKDGKELHVVKNNAIIEVYNIEKLHDGKNSLVTKLIPRPEQVRRYFTWCDCETPKYLTDIARDNQEKDRNNW